MPDRTRAITAAACANLSYVVYSKQENLIGTRVMETTIRTSFSQRIYWWVLGPIVDRHHTVIPRQLSISP
jgi:hypothetical protein